ncbi:MAG: DNA-directed RNA polymerase subunit omega [Ignavibacteria bacterium]|nr:DNA-directed RNA polymerase subunit omega [Ignavibacteria bacterium]
MPLKTVDLEQFINTTKNIHEAIVVSSKRARQINEDLKIEFNQRVEQVVTRVETEATEEMEINPDQLKVSIEFERRPKATDLALDELMDGEVEWRYKEVEDPLASGDSGS